MTELKFYEQKHGDSEWLTKQAIVELLKEYGTLKFNEGLEEKMFWNENQQEDEDGLNEKNVA